MGLTCFVLLVVALHHRALNLDNPSDLLEARGDALGVQAQRLVIANHPPRRVGRDTLQVSTPASLEAKASHDMTTTTNVVLLVNGYHFSRMARFLDRLRLIGFSGKVKVLCPPHICSKVSDQERQDWKRRLDRDDSLSVVEIATSFPTSSKRYPFFASRVYLDERVATGEEGNSTLYGFVDVENTHWCTNPFEASATLGAHKNIAAVEQVFMSQHVWDTRHLDTNFDPAPSPNFFVGTARSLRRFLHRALQADEGEYEVLRHGPGAFGKAQRVVLDPNQFVLMTEERCTTLQSPLDEYCSAHPGVVMLLDQHRCVKELADHTDFCPSYWSEAIYQQPNAAHPITAGLLEKNVPGLHRALRNFATDDARRRAVYETPYQPPQPSLHSCPRQKRSAIFGIAAGYTPDRVESFVGSFLRRQKRHTSASTDSVNPMVPCSTLVMFVSKVEDFRNYRPGWSSVEWVDVDDYGAKSQNASCPFAERRMEIYFRWMKEQYQTHVTHGMVGIVDVRDVVFQDDPFDALSRSSAWRSSLSNHDEWLLFPSESFVANHMSPYVPPVKSFFEKWIDSAFGSNYRKAFQQLPISARSNEPLPVICGGLFFGTGRAMFALLAIMTAALLPTGCNVLARMPVDQALLTVLAVDGLQIAEFPWAILMANPEYSVFRNGYERSSHVIWKEVGSGGSGGVGAVNCYGEQYAVLHQIEHERHPWVWFHITGDSIPLRHPPRYAFFVRGDQDDFKPKDPNPTQTCPSSSLSTPARRHGIVDGDEQPSARHPAATANDLIVMDGKDFSEPYLFPVLRSIRSANCSATVVVIMPDEKSHTYLLDRWELVNAYGPIVLFPAYAHQLPSTSSIPPMKRSRRDVAFFIAVYHFLQSNASSASSSPSSRVVIASRMGIEWHSDLFKHIAEERRQSAGAFYTARNGKHDWIDNQAFDQCHFYPRSVESVPRRYLMRFISDIFAASSMSLMLHLFKSMLVEGDAFGGVALLETCSAHGAINVLMHFYAHLVAPLVHVWSPEFGPVVVQDMAYCAKLKKMNASMPRALCWEEPAAVTVVDYHCKLKHED